MNLSVVLLIADGTGCRDLMAQSLRNRGFSVATVTSLRTLNAALSGNTAAVVWDVESPGNIVSETLTSVAKQDHIAKLIISKTADNRAKVQCYQQGVDMFFQKPVDPREVSCALVNLVRKLSKLKPKGLLVNCSNAWTLQSTDWNLLTPTDHYIALTQKERNFLVELMLTDNLTVSKEQLLKKLGYEAKGLHGRKAMDVMLTQLRKKIKDTTDLDAPIKTIYQQGFQFTAPYCVTQ